jgi:uncharacterized phage protein gp47/JayE
VSADLAGRLGLSGLLPRSVLLALAYVVAGAVHLLYGYLDWLSRQQFPQTSDLDGLLQWADLRGVVRIPAQFATGTATFTGQVGTTFGPNVQLQRADGAVFRTRAPATVGSDGTVSTTVQAKVAGASSNSVSGTMLTLSSSIPGVSPSATIDPAGLAGGSDAESDDALRARVLEAWREPARGGSADDWIAWTREVAGVVGAWVYPQTPQVGAVTVTFTVDDASGGPIPNDAQVAAVLAHLQVNRPVTAQLFVFAPVALPVDVALHVDPSDAPTQAAVEAALEDLFKREAAPGGTILLSHLQEAISLADGEHDHVLSSPSADVVAPFGRLPVLGTVSFS